MIFTWFRQKLGHTPVVNPVPNLFRQSYLCHIYEFMKTTYTYLLSFLRKSCKLSTIFILNLRPRYQFEEHRYNAAQASPPHNPGWLGALRTYSLRHDTRLSSDMALYLFEGHSYTCWVLLQVHGYLWYLKGVDTCEFSTEYRHRNRSSQRSAFRETLVMVYCNK